MTNCNRKSGVVGWSFRFSTLIFALGGCGDGSSSPQGEFTVDVSIQQLPVENVRVAFAVKGDPSSSIVLEGITDHTGTAAMLRKQGVELAATPTEYEVICESLGDWQVAKPWSDFRRTPLKMTWPSEEQLRIELPAKAARSL